METASPSIELVPRRIGGQAPELAPHLRIQSEKGWLLKGSPAALDDAATALVGVSERISSDVLLLDFGNAVGFFDVPELGRIEVISGKWGREDFDHMLAELTEIAAGLPFSTKSSAALPYDRSIVAKTDILYHMFVYIRFALSDAPANRQNLNSALRQVLRDLYRRFTHTRRVVSVDQMRHLDGSTLATIATGAHGFTPILHLHATRQRVPSSLRGHLPNHVHERHVESAVDTPENRFVKAFLGIVVNVIEVMREAAVADGPSAFSIRVAQDCDRLAALLRPIVAHHLWDDVGSMQHLPASSQVLQRRRGYRDIYFHFARMRMAARVPLKESVVHDLLEAKDIAQLYEIWSYFAIVQEVIGILGNPVRAEEPQTTKLHTYVPHDLECVWPNGVRLKYNPSYSRSRKDQHSFSVPLRPDIALEVPHGPNAGLHLLDAKFKVDKLSDVMPTGDESAADEPFEVEERRGTFRRGDLYKMHAYRDAITAARSVWIIYPGSETRFYSASGHFAGRAELPDPLDGVGAIPLRPGDAGRVAIRTLLRRLLSSDDDLSQMT